MVELIRRVIPRDIVGADPNRVSFTSFSIICPRLSFGLATAQEDGRAGTRLVRDSRHGRRIDVRATD